MAKLPVLGAAILVASALTGVAFAQNAGPLTNREVVGDWALTITPAGREGIEITVEMDDDDLPLTIRAQPTGSLTCSLRGEPAECRIRNGRLVVVMPTRSGSGRMIFTLTDRTRGGFRGATEMRVRFLPIGGHIGTVNMARR